LFFENLLIRMAYKKSYEQQVAEHVAFLRACGLDVDDLQLQPKTGPFVACREIGSASNEKTLAYKTFMNPMNNGGCGLVTIARLKDRSQKKFATHGYSSAGTSHDNPLVKEGFNTQNDLELQYEGAAKKARGLWGYSLASGRSDYLERKRVGSYGIRFRSNDKYGNVAIVPLRDIHGVLWSYQFLNKDGTKPLAENARAKGLFHVLTGIVDGKPIGIAESYVTAATCYELSGVSCVAAFGCDNFQVVSCTLREHYPLSPIIIFADNDRHKVENPGMTKAKKAACAISNTYVVEPDFGDTLPSKDTSDWNDLMLLIGVEAARQQLIAKVMRLSSAV
jgi:phage/plasmid primase-like uncharacterized protein